VRRWLFLAAAVISLVVGIAHGLDVRDLAQLLRVIGHAL
jgi:hypothetical protein